MGYNFFQRAKWTALILARAPDCLQKMVYYYNSQTNDAALGRITALNSSHFNVTGTYYKNLYDGTMHCHIPYPGTVHPEPSLNFAVNILSPAFRLPTNDYTYTHFSTAG